MSRSSHPPDLRRYRRSGLPALVTTAAARLTVLSIGALAVAAAGPGCTDTPRSQAQGATARDQDGPVGEAQNALLSGNACVFGQACQSVEATVTIERGGGVGNVFDTGVNNNGVSSNGGSGISGTIPIGDSGSPSQTPRQELMNFDLTPITSLGGAGYNIVEAQVSLYFCTSAAGQTINVHQATQSWGATTAQFSTYETTVSWPSFNESFVATPITSFGAGAANAFPGCIGSGHSPSNARFDISSLVSGWVNGTTPEDGILMEQPPVMGVSTTVLTSEYPPVLSGYHPTLFVQFNVSCATGTADCDDNGLNGCETNITTTQNCGACGNACAAGQVCTAGACTPLVCAAGTANCNGLTSDGCEVSTATDPNNCGGCGDVCALTHVATDGCAGGACTVVTCSAGYANCDGVAANGCEVSTATDPNNCGGCGDVCALPNVAADGCAGGACTVVTCSAGYANCDGVAANGCEVDTQVDAGNCGGCGNACTPDQLCTNGACTALTCAPGTADCDGLAADGCEVNTQTDASNCGGCGMVCSFPNAAALCSGGACDLGACDPGYADCDGLAPNGCEVNTQTDPDNCGGCGTRVDTQTDPNNCGGCGTVCLNGGSCADAACVCIDGCSGPTCAINPCAGQPDGTDCVDTSLPYVGQTTCLNGKCGGVCE